MNLYCISGLGADQRLFIKFKPQGYALKFIQWVQPEPQDTLGSYSRKLLSQIDQSRPFALLGVSLGGMIAVELSRRCSPGRVFVVSSIKTSHELPLYIYPLKWFRFLISFSLLKASKPFIQLLFGRLNQKDKHLIYKMIDESNPGFTVWAAKAILTWQTGRDVIPMEKIVHIVGDKDLIFKFSALQNAVVIKNGTHLMILNKAEEIARLVEKFNDIN